MFDRYYAPLCRFAEFWLRDRASAEEVVLDVYTHVWQHAAELRITVSVRAYLFRAVRNRALNRLRDDRFSYIPFEELGEVFASPESLQIETDEITQLVAEAVSQLPGRCRDIFLKSRNEQLSNAEIAAEMHISDVYKRQGYPNVAGANKGGILEIRRERTIELAMEGFRYYDIMRWKEGKTFEQPLLGLYIPAKGEYDIDGDGTPDVYFATKGETPSTTAKLTLVIDQDILFSDGDHGYISPHKNNPGIWDETRDYFYPIPTDDRSLTGGALTQNPGWNDGLNF